MEENAKRLASLARAASLALFALPALLLTVLLFLISQPSSGASFAAEAWFLTPLFILSATLAAHAVRERSSAYAFSAGLVMNLAATFGCLFGTDVKLVPVIQANLIVSALCSL